MGLLIEMCASFQLNLSEQEVGIKVLEDQNNFHIGNSSMSPSSDTAWRSPKKRSLREPTDKAIGDQTSHYKPRGKLSDTPDKIVPLVADVCPPLSPRPEGGEHHCYQDQATSRNPSYYPNYHGISTAR
jgi:hypothetical protein